MREYREEKRRPVEITVQAPDPHSKKQALIMSAFQIPTVRKIYVACGSKYGKALILQEKVPTVGGWKTMGEIRPGDKVFDEHGKPTTVLTVTDPMLGRDCYEVLFSDGNTVRADADHEWITETHACRKNTARALSPNDRCHSTTYKPEKVTTRQILETLTVRMGGKERPNHSIDMVTGPIEFESKDLPVPPYTLGVWLGDGSKSNGTVTNPDKDVWDGVREDGFELSFHNVKQEGACEQFTVLALMGKLKEAGVFDNKHVPHTYLIAGKDQRLALLQGLMDTDGTIDKRGNSCFDNTNKNLVDAVEALAISFGIKGNRYTKQGRLYGVDKKLCYRFQFTTDLPVFRHSSKAARLRPVSAKSKRRYIVAVTPIQSEPVKCITVDSPTHLFLAGAACIPTHNSLSASACLSHAAIQRRDTKWRWLAPVYEQAKVGMDYFRKMLPPAPHSEFKDNAMRVHLPYLGTEIQFWHCKNAVSLEGPGIHGNIFDEAAKCPYDAVASAQTTVTFTKGPQGYFSTPFGKNWFYRECMEAKEHMAWAIKNGKNPERIFLTAPTTDNPFIDPSVVEEARRSLPDRLFRQYFMAEFIDDGSVFIGFRDCIAGNLIEVYGGTQHWVHEQGKEMEVFIGADWAKKEDFTVFTALTKQTGRPPSLVGFLRFQGIGYVEALKELYNFSKKFKNVINIKHDRTGVGEAIDDMLGQLTLPFEGVIFTNASKAAMVNQLMMGFETREIELCQWPEMISELESYSVETNELGTARYSAPPGLHDDIVSSLMLSYSAAREYSAEFKLQFAEDLPNSRLSVEKWYNDLIIDADDE